MKWGGTSMALYEEMIGKEYGDLTVLSYSHSENKKYYDKSRKKERVRKKHFLKVSCKCGKEKLQTPFRLKSGRSKSCGCRGGHGKSYTRIYRIYRGIKNRCYNENATDFKDYGGRGIKMCDEWLGSFQAFNDWSIKNGYTNKLSIDRKDNEGGYTPDNCRWVNWLTQNNNRRSNVYITYGGRKLSASEWARKLNVSSDTLTDRKRRGWTDEEIITTPIGGKR